MRTGAVRIGITLGDTAGIGPEVAVKAACGRRWPAGVRLLLIGDRAAVARECRRGGWPVPPAADPRSAVLPRVGLWEPVPGAGPAAAFGRVSARTGRRAAAWIAAGARAALRGDLDAIVTAPISKEGLARAGVPFPGHTEMLAALTGARRFAMMLIGGPLRVVLATRHIPLADVPRAVTAAGIVEAAGMAASALGWLGVGNRRIAVCALNPHAGEGGVLGREERTVIRPAVRRVRAGIRAAGPVPADVVFHQAARGAFGAVVAMYHDQGLGPLKLLAFESGVNLTLGLPIVRTSPDHGTAYDIAGKGVADPSSMAAAIRLAAALARRRNPWTGKRRRAG